MMHWLHIPALLRATTFFAFACAAHAQMSWPSEPVRLVVPSSAGGTPDAVARLLAPKLTERWRQPVVVDNQAGGSGALGSKTVADSRPDGHTLLLGNLEAQAIIPAFSKLPYDPSKAFAPISLVAELPSVLVANPVLPARDVKELIALAKQSPGKLNYASAGNGTFSHLAAEMFIARTDVSLVHVPYQGGARAITDVLGGQVNLMIAPISLALDYIRSGKLKALAVTSRTRVEGLSDIPTLSESGLRDFDATQWVGVLAPYDTKPELVSRIRNDVRDTLSDPSVQKALLKLGVKPRGSTAAEFSARIENDNHVYGRLIASAGRRMGILNGSANTLACAEGEQLCVKTGRCSRNGCQ